MADPTAEDQMAAPHERPVSDDFSLALGHMVARRLLRDPAGVLAAARRNLSTMRRAHDEGSADPWLDTWERLLDGPVEAVAEVLVTDDERCRQLRQNTPFAGVVPERDRQDLLQHVRSQHRAT